MKFYTCLASGIAVCLLTVAPAFAQNMDNSTTPDSKKQETQGLPAGTMPPQYGANASKQQTQGLPPDTAPAQYGANASKQQTQGLPAGTTPRQFGANAKKQQT